MGVKVDLLGQLRFLASPSAPVALHSANLLRSCSPHKVSWAHRGDRARWRYSAD
jgi:hypothetical protein